MREILEKVQQIQSDLLGKKTVYVNTHTFKEGDVLIHVSIFADVDDDDNMQLFQFLSSNSKELIDEKLRKLDAYVEYAKKL